ncbi:MAG: methionyl-tRNA formyltransferase [Deltaproteobacteria bacterium]|nr:methionyl-tRNA formyltransferase [Deltaproteobacteria bacterium]
MNEEQSLKGVRIIFMGTPEFAVPSLNAILEAGAEVRGVVTQAAKPLGRGKIITDSPVKKAALKHGLKVLEPLKVRDNKFIDELRAENPDVIVVVAYGKILPREILELAPLGCINLHSSLLPAYRGAAPINWAIINGDKKSGVSTMLLDAGMDTGPVLLTDSVEVGDTEKADSLTIRLSKLGASLLVKTIRGLRSGEVLPKPQDEKLASYAPLLKKVYGLIDWSKSAGEIANRMRGLYPWPGTYTHMEEKLLKVHEGKALEENDQDGEPGTVLGFDNSGVRVKCGRGVFLITELQIEGKKRMGVEDFLKGHALEGVVFE